MCIMPLLLISLLLNLKKKFNWWTVALQCCIDFCHTTSSAVSVCVYIYIYIYMCVCVCVCVCVYTHTSLPVEPPSHPYPHLTPLGCCKHQAELPVLHSSFPLASYFTRSSVDTSTLLSQFIPLSPSHLVSTNPFFSSASLFLSYA